MEPRATRVRIAAARTPGAVKGRQISVEVYAENVGAVLGGTVLALDGEAHLQLRGPIWGLHR